MKAMVWLFAIAIMFGYAGGHSAQAANNATPTITDNRSKNILPTPELTAEEREELLKKIKQEKLRTAVAEGRLTLRKSKYYKAEESRKL